MQRQLVIFTYGGGRTCNQMLNCVHLLAVRYESIEPLEICNLPALEFEALFPGLVHELSSAECRCLRIMVKGVLFATSFNNRVRRKAIEHLLPVILHSLLPAFGVQWVGVLNERSKWIRGSRLTMGNLSKILAERKLAKTDKIVLGGWGLRDWPLSLKYRARLSGLIKQNNAHMDAASVYLSKHRHSDKRLIGVLIRQTDYRLWEQGHYFYTTEEYVQIMRHLAINGDVQFVVASDEPQERAKFSGLDVIFASGREIGQAHYMESFFELSMCSTIVSPPSSFALMAAYIGNGRLLKLADRRSFESGSPVTTISVDDCWVDPDFRKVC